MLNTHHVEGPLLTTFYLANEQHYSCDIADTYYQAMIQTWQYTFICLAATGCVSQPSPEISSCLPLNIMLVC